SASTFWDVVLAVARTDVPAWLRIWARLSAAVSTAKSASRICDSLAVMFSNPTCSELMLVWIVFFSNAPRRPRSTDTSVMADSTARDVERLLHGSDIGVSSGERQSQAQRWRVERDIEPLAGRQRAVDQGRDIASDIALNHAAILSVGDREERAALSNLFHRDE